MCVNELISMEAHIVYIQVFFIPLCWHLSTCLGTWFHLSTVGGDDVPNAMQPSAGSMYASPAILMQVHKTFTVSDILFKQRRTHDNTLWIKTDDPMIYSEGKTV